MPAPVQAGHPGSWRNAPAARTSNRGFSASSLILRMTREEIGSYLGLKLETVSRAFSRFQDEGLLSVKQRQIEVLDPEALQEHVNGSSLLSLNARPQR